MQCMRRAYNSWFLSRIWYNNLICSQFPLSIDATEEKNQTLSLGLAQLIVVIETCVTLFAIHQTQAHFRSNWILNLIYVFRMIWLRKYSIFSVIFSISLSPPPFPSHEIDIILPFFVGIHHDVFFFFTFFILVRRGFVSSMHYGVFPSRISCTIVIWYVILLFFSFSYSTRRILCIWLSRCIDECCEPLFLHSSHEKKNQISA